MNEAAAAPPARLGFRLAACGHEVHYRSHTCPTCGAENIEAKPPADGAVVIEPYVVMQDFRTMLGDVTGVFKKNMVLTDQAQINALKHQGAPIVPSSQVNGLACCPACQHVFPLVANAAGRKRAG